MSGLAGLLLLASCATPRSAAAPSAAAPAPSAGMSARVARGTTSLAGPLDPEGVRWIERSLASLTLRERVAQMVMVWVLGDYTSTTDAPFAAVADRVRDDKIGGVVMSLGSPFEVAAKVNDLQRLASIPLLVASDLEPGLGRLEGGVFAPSLMSAGSATVIPNNMAIGATGNPEQARTAGRIIGREARAIGIHLVFAPTVDVNNNPANPVINVRSFGEDPTQVAAMSRAFVEGMQGEGVAATAKHFPGHGDTDTDSHLALPIVASSRAQLDTVELVPFRAAIAGGLAAMMTAHVALPAVSRDSVPATLVASIMQGLLRDTLGFKGLTVTDALDMRGVGQGYSVEESAVRAVQAGADLLLMPSDVPRTIDAVVAAVGRGTLTPARIDASVRRLLEMKWRTGAVARPIVPLDSLRARVGTAEHRAAAQYIATEAVTLLRDRASLLPFRSGAPTIVVSYGPENDLMAGRSFAAELRLALPRARVVRISPSTSRAQLDSIVRPGERVIVATFVRTIEGDGRFSVAEPVARWLDSIATQVPVAVAAFGNPYVLREFPRVGSYLATFGRGEALERAAARALTGRRPITGRAPISLPGFFRRGDGIARPSLDGMINPLPPAILQDSIRALLSRAVADSAFPGAFAIVGRRSGVLAQVGVGRLDWAADAPRPDARTVWDLASLTKVIGLTSAMMQLVERGEVELDAPVQRYLPEWTGPNKDRVTVRHLLTHSSGLPGWRPLYKEADSPDSARRMVLATPLDTVPGARMVYSDLGAILAGMIVERVSGQKLDAFLASRVFGPLGMSETRFLPPAAWRDRIAPTEIDPWRRRHLRGEVHDENAFALGGVSAHAGLFSTGADLARFAQMYLGGGTLDGTRVFASGTVRQFTAVQDSAFSHRALGWETPTGSNSAGRLMKRPAFGHTGFTGTSFWVDPTNDLFVILLTNRVNPTRQNLRIGAVRGALADLVERSTGPSGAP